MRRELIVCIAYATWKSKLCMPNNHKQQGQNSAAHSHGSTSPVTLREIKTPVSFTDPEIELSNSILDLVNRVPLTVP